MSNNIEPKSVDVEVIIFNNQTGDNYVAITEGPITWTTQLSGTAGKMECTVVKDDVIDFRNGNTFTLRINKEAVFAGYCFVKSRTKAPVIDVTAYDQLRYLKNKTTLKYKDVTASGLLELCAEDAGLQLGDVEEASATLETRIEENKEYFEIINNGIEKEQASTGNIFVMYDNVGKIDFKNIQNMMITDTVFNAGRIGDFDYVTSIDEGTYNTIRVDQVDQDAGIITPIIKTDEARVKDWGFLQFYAQSTEPRGVIEQKMETLLPLLSREIRSLKLKEVLGDVRVRAGSIIPVSLNLGDMELVSAMLVTECTHSVMGNKHVMDLTVENKTFMPAINPDGVFVVENKQTAGSSAGGGVGGRAPENTNAGKLWNYFIAQGFSKEATAGILGNLEQESGIDPRRPQDNGGPGRGLAQWTYSDRWQGLLQYAHNKGLDPYDLMTQAEFIIWESEQDGIFNPIGGLEAFKNITDVAEATKMFERYYERAGTKVLQKRIGYAEKYYNQWANLGSGVGTGQLIFPVAGHSMANKTSGYGGRNHPLSGNYSFHGGLDIGAPGGTPIYASDSGVVEKAGWVDDSSYGINVLIDHGGGMKTRSAHMSRTAVSPGQTVNKGGIIGYVGSTGASTGNHLHFEVIINGQRVNPEYYL